MLGPLLAGQLTRADFLGMLRRIEDEFRATARLPVLHIETHGNYDGIGVSDEEGFTFHELMEALIPLNTLTGLRLIVVMSACLGMWAVKMLQPVTRAACLAVIARRVGRDMLVGLLLVGQTGTWRKCHDVE